MSARRAQAIRFGGDGNDRHYLGSGWSGDEPGYRWMVGDRSELWLEHPGPGTAYVLDLTVEPFTRPPELPYQRLVLRARGREVLRAALDQVGSFGCTIPAEALAGDGPVRLELEHPDARAPASFGAHGDDRPLAFSARRLHLIPVDGAVAGTVRGHGGLHPSDVAAQAGIPASELATRFESLGDNCEFGLVQRRCGVEVLSLLRFTYIAIPLLLRGLEERFAPIGDPAGLHVTLDNRGSAAEPREYIVRDASYDLTYHTWQLEHETDAATLAAKQPARQRFLARKLLGDLEDGEKIFVLRRNPPPRLPEALAVYAAINRIARNRLLFIDLPRDQQPPGTVEEIIPGLYRGTIDRLAPDENAHDMSFECWMEILANTWRLARSAATDAAGT
ncbi:hypothetical protein [Acidisphaera rubrifaciens]|uniref:Uncharacterized protein n=1 Tax=Acidisphaera rubrifaciens HS-AP3 TaxID=1231350 RepID=A0A0D6P7A9_9PROT|nr:hypothetical protein [Acidisphaera rubrifaciens]GAN77577.1 hypothetical protein Asru_0382_02 [Acidisphaera rubrifaciens HS-AP3]